MFTKDQIIAAKSQVKSGADFPRLIRDFKQMGIVNYHHFVATGTTVYFSANGVSLDVPEKQELLTVNAVSSAEHLLACIKIHQAGKTDYPTFCKQAAEAGVEKWITDLQQMTVSYVDQAGNILLAEPIPGGDY